jgi:hypothetical protein
MAPLLDHLWQSTMVAALAALLKLQDLEKFSTMFLGYDLLARRWVPYSYIYPFAEGAAGILMVAGVLTWLSAPLALFIGSIGAVFALFIYCVLAAVTYGYIQIFTLISGSI